MLELIVAILKTGSATVVNLLVTAITVKIVAIFTGPAGVGAWSLLRQSQQTAVSLGTASGAVSFVRGISQLPDSERGQFARTVAVSYLVLGGAVALGLVVFSSLLSQWVGTLSAQIFAWLALPVLVAIFRDYIIALLNGIRAIGRLAVAQVAGAAAGAVLAYPAAKMVEGGNYGGFIFLMLATGAISSLVAVYFLWRSDAQLEFNVRPWWTLDSFKRFARLAGVMSIIVSYAGLVLFACRTLIARYRGIDEAGYFDVAWSLGLTYVGLILNAFGTFYLPKLSSSNDEGQTRLIQYITKLTVMIMGPLIVMMILLKPWIIAVFYSQAFMPSLDIFQWLLVSDYLKISTWIFSIVVMVRGHDKTILLGSLLWDSGLLASVLCVIYFHLPTADIGRLVIALNCFGLIGYSRVMTRLLPIRFPMRVWAGWLAGLLCVLLATKVTSGSTTVELSNVWVWVLTVAVSLCGLTAGDLAAVRQLMVKYLQRKA